MVDHVLLTGSRARNFAETRWGRGGTTASRTNRPGAFYYSCSSHGGYIVDAKALTLDEYHKVQQYVKPEKCLVVVNPKGKATFFQNPYRMTRARYGYNDQDQIIERKVFFFEEDSDWAVLEHLTGIAPKLYGLQRFLRKHHAEKTFNQYYKQP